MENREFISIVVPCYNEEENISVFYKEILKIFDEEKYQYELIFVDDGSKDKTLEILKGLSAKDSRVKYLSFSRNFGHQNALKAGLDFSSGDAVVSLDADLQHPVEVIPLLVDKWKEGCDVVYTIREDNKNISFFKKQSAKIFYSISNNLSGVKVEPGAADFRLLSRNVVDAFKSMPENFLFIRGLISWLGFNQVSLHYKAADRYSGTSKYTLTKMMKLASDGITSFSTRPLKLSIYLGVGFSLLAFLYAIYAVLAYFFSDNVVAGWTSVLFCVVFFSGLILIMLGIIGEYIGKIFIENKRRPNYIVKESNLD